MNTISIFTNDCVDFVDLDLVVVTWYNLRKPLLLIDRIFTLLLLLLLLLLQFTADATIRFGKHPRSILKPVNNLNFANKKQHQIMVQRLCCNNKMVGFFVDEPKNCLLTFNYTVNSNYTLTHTHAHEHTSWLLKSETNALVLFVSHK